MVTSMKCGKKKRGENGMNESKEEIEPKWYLIGSSAMGFNPDKLRYTEFPTEEEYFDKIRKGDTIDE